MGAEPVHRRLKCLWAGDGSRVEYEAQKSCADDNPQGQIKPAECDHQPAGRDGDEILALACQGFFAHAPGRIQNDRGDGGNESGDRLVDYREFTPLEIGHGEADQQEERGEYDRRGTDEGPDASSEFVSHVRDDVDCDRTGQEGREGDSVDHFLGAKELPAFNDDVLNNRNQRHKAAEGGRTDA